MLLHHQPPGAFVSPCFVSCRVFKYEILHFSKPHWGFTQLSKHFSCNAHTTSLLSQSLINFQISCCSLLIRHPKEQPYRCDCHFSRRSEFIDEKSDNFAIMPFLYGMMSPRQKFLLDNHHYSNNKVHQTTHNLRTLQPLNC